MRQWLLGDDRGPVREGHSFTDHPRSALIASILATVFSLMIIPAWVVMLSAAGDENWVLFLLLVVFYGLACVLAVPLVRRKSWFVQGAVCAIVLATGLALVGLTGQENAAILVCALGVVATLMPHVVTFVVTAVTVGALTWSAFYTGNLTGLTQNMVMLVSVVVATVLAVGLVNAYTELKAARDQIAMFAVAKERERFARDLHDILGHSLTTITLKAGLARRVLEIGEVEQSRQELLDLERLGRQALNDIRATVSEYRDVTLAGELAAANETLRAAGITADLPYAVDNVEPELQRAFAYVLREAITNAVRHSQAEHVSVQLERWSITVTDDGVGTSAGPSDGNGLLGLAERLREFNAVLDSGPGPLGGFVVRAQAAPSKLTASD